MHRWAGVIGLVSLLALGCGGGTASPTASPTPASSADVLLQLDERNFDALVLDGGRVALVEFHSPT